MKNKRPKIKFKTCISESHTADSTESGAIIGSNNDLLTEILRRLPITSIFRFKCVSKHWQSLLSHPRFTLSYDNVSVSSGLFVHDSYLPFDDENETPPYSHTLDFYPDRCGIKILQSCNGLLLCCSKRGKEDTRKYYVFNPTTKQSAVIPSIIGCLYARKTIRFMGLAFHRTDCVHYKLVCFHTVFRNGYLFQIQIYSSESRKWRISQRSFSVSYFTHSSYGTYSNGAIHWIPNYSELIYFNIEEEQLQKILLPGRSSSSFLRMEPLYFGESEGHVHLVEVDRHGIGLHLNVYELSRDYSGWFIKYRVELDEVPTGYPDRNRSLLGYRSEMIETDYDFDVLISDYLFEVFDVVRGEGEEEEATFMVVRTPENITRYDVVNRSSKKITDLPSLLCNVTIGFTNVHRYIQSISSF